MLSDKPAAFTDNASEATRTKNNLQSSASDTITGYYKYFIGECDAIAADKSNLTSAVIRGLSKSSKMSTS